jgi:hypothetical protein
MKVMSINAKQVTAKYDGVIEFLKDYVHDK